MALTSQQVDNDPEIIAFTTVRSLMLQPVTGLLHHIRRAATTLAIIAGRYGLQLSCPNHTSYMKGVISYGVIAGAIWLVYVILIFFHKSRSDWKGEHRECIFTSDREKQSVNSANFPENGSKSLSINHTPASENITAP